MRRTLIVLLLAGLTVRAEKDLGAPQAIPAAHWEQPFQPGLCTLVGSYTTVIRLPADQAPTAGRFVAFNNSASGGLDAGLVMWRGRDQLQFEAQGVVFSRREVTDVLGQDGELYADRMITRPFLDWHPDVGFIGIVHVCAGYGPIDGRVYPALVESRTGAAGSWVYHGKLKGEIWEEFGDQGTTPVWADGGGFFYQPEKPAELNLRQPYENRYVFCSNKYAGRGSLTLLLSADGKQWSFYRDADGKIADLTPFLSGRDMIFPHLVRLGAHGWMLFLSEAWPPTQILRLWSADGLAWQLFGEQPELPKPDQLMIKNVNGWYDPETAILHGYLSVWSAQPDGSRNYDKYYSLTRDLQPPATPAR